ncbi:MAG TPA: hypothetical protein VHL09_03520 [Dehalococcoidia bacterium]|nr:hypothetical protein [Dehalococcoidia bacterium]
MRSEREIRQRLDLLVRALTEAEEGLASANPGTRLRGAPADALATIGLAAMALKWAVGDADTATFEQIIADALANARNA